MKISNDDVLDTILKNRISSVEVADALDKTGVLPYIQPLNKGHFVAGEVIYVCAFYESNWELHRQIADIAENKIIYIDTYECKNRAIFGDIVSKYLLLYKNCKAIIVNGFVRDTHHLYKENYPIWCLGSTPLGCFNADTGIDENALLYMTEQQQRFERAILIADDSGCTLIEKENVTEELLKKLEFIELQEDIWYYCLDTLKMNTFEIICEKKYLEDPNMLPAPLVEKLRTIKKKENE